MLSNTVITMTCPLCCLSRPNVSMPRYHWFRNSSAVCHCIRLCIRGNRRLAHGFEENSISRYVVDVIVDIVLIPRINSNRRNVLVDSPQIVEMASRYQEIRALRRFAQDLHSALPQVMKCDDKIRNSGTCWKTSRRIRPFWKIHNLPE